jgi:hypothetical protein
MRDSSEKATTIVGAPLCVSGNGQRPLASSGSSTQGLRFLACLLLALLLGASCAQPAATATATARGVIVDLRVRDIAHTDSFVLRTDDGELLELKASATLDFTPAHLRDHMLFAQPVGVTYINGPDGKLALQITD